MNESLRFDITPINQYADKVHLLFHARCSINYGLGTLPSGQVEIQEISPRAESTCYSGHEVSTPEIRETIDSVMPIIARVQSRRPNKMAASSYFMEKHAANV
jgi:hypothetical protein